MKIGIIGVGAIGGTIAKKLVKAGHKVSVANSKGKEGVSNFANEIGAEPRNIQEISKDIDILILSIPFGSIPKLPKIIFENLPQSSIVVDTSNYYPEIRKEDFDESKPESVYISEQIGRKIIKTFNNILADSLQNLGKSKEEKNRLAKPNSAGYCCDYTFNELKEIKEKSKQTKQSVKENRKRVLTNFQTLTGGNYSHENII